MRRKRHQSRGFTLIEILIVISIIVVLIALLLPAMQQAREQARRIQCVNHMQQIGIALHAYQSAHNSLPPGCVNDTGPVRESASRGLGMGYSGAAGMSFAEEEVEFDENGRVIEPEPIDYGYRMSWLPQILPQLGFENVYRNVNFTHPERSFLTVEQLSYFRQQNVQSWNTDGSGAESVPEEGAAPDSMENSLGGMVDDSAYEFSSDGSYEDSQAGPPVARQPKLPILSCNSSPTTGATDYAGCHASTNVPIDSDNDGVLFLNSSIVTHEIPDGAGYTIMVGEKMMLPNDAGILVGDSSTLRNTGSPPNLKYGSGGGFGDTGNSQENMVPGAKGFSSHHNQTCNYLMADGSVRSIANMIADEVFRKLGSRNDGSLISAQAF